MVPTITQQDVQAQAVSGDVSLSTQVWPYAKTVLNGEGWIGMKLYLYVLEVFTMWLHSS